MAKSENETVIPWYLRVLALPFVAAGAVIGVTVGAASRLGQKVKGK